MKKFEIDITFRNKKVHIYLGNNECLNFKNKTHAEPYLRKYKKIILKSLYNLNNLYMNCSNVYRLFYFDLDQITNVKVQKALNLFEDSYDRIFFIYSEGNNNSFKFCHIDNCFVELQNALEILQNYSDSFKKNYSLGAQISSLKYMLETVKLKLEDDKCNLKFTKKMKVIKLRKAV